MHEEKNLDEKAQNSDQCRRVFLIANPSQSRMQRNNKKSVIKIPRITKVEEAKIPQEKPNQTNAII